MTFISQIKKWTAILISVLFSTFALYYVYFPILLVGSFVLTHNKDLSDVTKVTLSWILVLLPMGLVIFKFVQILFKDIKKLVLENLNPGSNGEILDPNLNYENEINQKIVNAFNNAKEKLGIKSSVKLIRVYDDIFNAYAISNLKGENAIAVFDGLAKNVPEEELQAVIGHELGHIKNRDSLTKVLLYASQYFIPTIEYYSDRLMVFIANLFKDMPFLNIFVYITIALHKLGSIFIKIGLWITQFINSFSYKQAEYIADYNGAKASSKESMIKILEKMEHMENNSSNNESALLKLLSEHPPAQKRIKYIQNIKS